MRQQHFTLASDFRFRPGFNFHDRATKFHKTKFEIDVGFSFHSIFSLLYNNIGAWGLTSSLERYIACVRGEVEMGYIYIH